MKPSFAAGGGGFALEGPPTGCYRSATWLIVVFDLCCVCLSRAKSARNAIGLLNPERKKGPIAAAVGLFEMTPTAKTDKFIVLSVYGGEQNPNIQARWANSGAVCPARYWILLLESNKITA